MNKKEIIFLVKTYLDKDVDYVFDFYKHENAIVIADRKSIYCS